MTGSPTAPPRTAQDRAAASPPPAPHDALPLRARALAPLATLGDVGRAWSGGTGVTADLPLGPLARLVADAEALAGAVDAVVLHEPDHPAADAPAPAYAAAVLAEIVPVVVVLSPRERNRVALEGEVAALADTGAGILVVSGRDRPGGVHDVAEPELAALARRSGAVTAVLAAPAQAHDVARVRRLARSGAHVCVTVPAAAAVRAAFARGLAQERGPRVVFGIAPHAAPALDTAALPGFAGFHVWGPPGGGVDDVRAAADRAREVLA